ncbi:MAG TPA: hypothetical protein VGV59_11525 [Pyrinomonadaceae bacterium]|nr:hypothetical protein [Pyrinomonadaceae bacterium]
MRQPTFFERDGPESACDASEVVLYALGDFQARGKVLAGRDLPLDRLRGALRRAAEAFGRDELDDESAVKALGALGAHVRRVPAFVAKHPYRVSVPAELAERGLSFLRERAERND